MRKCIMSFFLQQQRKKIYERGCGKDIVKCCYGACCKLLSEVSAFHFYGSASVM